MQITITVNCATPAFGKSPASIARELRGTLNRIGVQTVELAIELDKNGVRVAPLTINDRNGRPCATVEIAS